MDTTCTIWVIEMEVVDTQLIVHDKEVYDIAWGWRWVFASIYANDSVRVFELHYKEHSTIKLREFGARYAVGTARLEQGGSEIYGDNNNGQ